jgi:SAM-dependent methyltransferase
LKLRWGRPEGAEPRRGTSGFSPPPADARSCPGLARVLDRALRGERPSILDLGPTCGDSAVYLADRGARVSVEEFDPPAAIRFDQRDGVFDVVLLWEAIDFVPGDRLQELGSEIRRVLAPGGRVLMLSIQDPPREGRPHRRPPRYRILADDRVGREPVDGPAITRHGHATRDLERALAPLHNEGIHLQRDRMRELIFARPL